MRPLSVLTISTMLALFLKNQLHVALLGILLFGGQMSVLVHATEHPFHSDDDLCESFLLAEKLDDGPVSAEPALISAVTGVAIAPEITSLCIFSLQTAYFARAPPVIFA